MRLVAVVRGGDGGGNSSVAFVVMVGGGFFVAQGPRDREGQMQILVFAGSLSEGPSQLT